MHAGAKFTGIEVPPQFLHVLAVVAFGIRESEEAFLEARVFSVVQSKRQAEQLLLIAQAADAVFAPAVGS